MKIGRIARATVALALGGLAVSGVRAEDIDLYVSGTPKQNAPNVLIFLDNTSNWSSSAQAWDMCAVLAKCNGDATCATYTKSIFGATDAEIAGCSNRRPTSKSLTQGQVEVGALRLVVNELVCAAARPMTVNLGLMFFQPNSATGTVDGSNIISGYVRRAVLPLDATNCPGIVGDLTTIYNDITSPAFKGPSAASYGQPLLEAFKYFGGYTNPAHAANASPEVENDGAGTPRDRSHFGTQRYENLTGYEDALAFVTGDAAKLQYLSPINANNSCGRNYLIVVGNTWPNGDDKTLLSNLGYGTSALCCAKSGANQDRLGDVWTKFLALTDVSSAGGQQPVFTYALNVFNKTKDADQTKLLRSMALHGGTGEGGYFEVDGNIKTLIDAFRNILVSITAKNSVFASSSLPVSVNTQGTYLNQVFVGMFRPDSDAAERWPGNIKQYKFGLNAEGRAFLADGNGDPAVDNGTTGFIKQCAVSLWTGDSANYWQNVPVSITPEGGCPTPPAPHTAATTFSDWPDGSTVEKGAAGQLVRARSCGAGVTPTYCGRNIKTCASTGCSSMVDFNSTNVTLPVSSHSATTLCNYTSADLVNWVAGGNLGDGPPLITRDVSGVATACTYQKYDLQDSSLASKVRPSAHGDVVHSRPLAVNYGTGDTNDVVVFYGSGDGMFHAVDGNPATTGAGEELWAFVAPEFFGKFQRLRDGEPLISYAVGVPNTIIPTPRPRDYFFDGAIGAYQERDSSGAVTKMYVYPSMRRGGRMIYGFDATTRPTGTSATSPTFLWKFGCPNATNDTGCTGGSYVSRIGQTWSTPRIVRLKGDSNLYLAFGGGYDTCEDQDPPACTGTPKGTGVFVINAVTGAEVAYIDLGTFKDSAGNDIVPGRVAADLVPVDTNFDGYVDVIYAADSRGNLWRINTSDLGAGGNGTAPASWTTRRIAYMSDWTKAAEKRKFLYAPDVVTIGSVNFVLLGTGDREHPLDSLPASSVLNRFYGLRDSYANLTPPDAKGTDCDTAGNETLNAGCDLINITDTSFTYTNIGTMKGWVLDLDTTKTGATDLTREQVVTTPTTIGGVTFFSTFQPTDTTKNYSCSNLGTARGYAVNFLTGGLASGHTERSTIFTGGGLPPSPVSGLVSINGKLVPFVLGGKPSAGPGSALEGNTVPITVPSVRRKVYRYMKIDTQ